MAEDIMNLLVQSYNDNAREQAQNMNSAGRTINKMSTFTSNYDTRNIPSSAKPFFEKELKEIEKINNQELKRYENLYKKELELHQYSLKFKKDLWPMLLFQFGNCLFPDVELDDELLVCPQSVKRYDGKTVSI